MEDPVAPRHRERILTALSQVPVALTSQLARLNDSLDQGKKASAILRNLEADKLVQWEWHGREKLWSLSRKGRHLMKGMPRRSNELDHMLAVVNLYFTVQPTHWMYEPTEKFGKRYWRPDCILVFRKKLYAVEVQLSPLGTKAWVSKWGVYNQYFNEGHFKGAAYQKWAKSPPVMPEIMCISTQKPEVVKQGFNVLGRDLLVVKNLN